jgi:hypothetical protein
MLINFSDFCNKILESSKIVDYNKNKELLDIDLDSAKLPSKFNVDSYTASTNRNLSKISDFYNDIRQFVQIITNEFGTQIFDNFDERFVTPNIINDLSDFGKNLYKTDKRFKNSFDGLKEKVKNSKSFNALKKLGYEKGMTIDAIIYASSWIENFITKAGNKIPKIAYEYIKKLTIENLPKVIYRGFYYSADQIKDLPKFLKTWQKGNKPFQKLKKITSWTTSLPVASDFTIPQDNVTNEKNGFAIILKAIPKIENTIADLRNFENNSYHNQMEIIMDEDFVDYEVFMIKKGSKIGRDEINQVDLYGSMGTRTKSDILRDPFGYWTYKGFESEKEKLKSFVNLTPVEIENKNLGYYVKDFIPNFKDENLKKYWEQFSISLGAIVRDSFKNEITILKIYNKNSVKITANVNLYDFKLKLKTLTPYAVGDISNFYYTATISVAPTPLQTTVTVVVEDVKFENENPKFKELEKYKNLELFKKQLGIFYIDYYAKYKNLKFVVQ